MKIPPGMTEEELVKIIKDVVKTTINKTMAFGMWDVEELRAEATLECIKVLEKYDPTRPLPNFLRTHVRNRYLNLRRDEFHRPGDSDEHPKKLLSTPIDLESVDHEGESNISFLEEYDVDKKELWKLVDKHLPTNLRHDYLKMKNGEHIVRTKRIAIINKIKEIIWNLKKEED